MKMRPVSCIEAGDVDTYVRAHDALEEPVVFRGIASGWPAMRTLSLESLRRSFGEVFIPTRESDDEFREFFGPRKDDSVPRKNLMKLSDYLEAVFNSHSTGARPPYAGNISLLGDPRVARQLGELVSSCNFPAWLDKSSRKEYRLWVGAQGQRSTIHNDPYHNFNAQIVGRKYFLLFAPQQHGKLYPQFFHEGMWASPLDPRHPNLDKFPEFEAAQAYEHELGAGDILCIPRFWWHYVEGRAACVNVNMWVYSELTEGEWWHQQPSARNFINYQDVLDTVCRQFDALPLERKELRRPKFEALRQNLLTLAECQGSASGSDNPLEV